MRTSLQGLARLSDTIASRDAQLEQLLSATRKVTQVLADRNGEFTQLIVDSNTLLTEVQERRQLIDSILTSTQDAVRSSCPAWWPTTARRSPRRCSSCPRVTDILSRNRAALGPDGQQPGAVRPGLHQHPGQRPLVRQLRQQPAARRSSARSLCGGAARRPLPVGCAEGNG